MPMPASQGADFVVLCGFLGSGKTTLLGDFLAQDATGSTAVIVNDVGEFNVDGAILAQAGDLSMARLSNGCVCCSLANDLLYTIEALVQGRQESGETPFARILLECSGIADPGPILRSLGELAHLRMRVRIVSTYSCIGRPELIARFDEASAQLAAAHAVVLTKLDLIEASALDAAVANARSFSPLAAMVVEADPIERARLAFGGDFIASQDLAPAASPRNAPHERLLVGQLDFAEPLPWPDMEDWLENLVGYFGERLLRIKGVVPVLGVVDPVLVQGVGGHIDLPRRLRGGGSTSGLFVVLRDATLAEFDDIVPALTGARISAWQAPRERPRSGIAALCASTNPAADFPTEDR
jgi:G3E family GTPase